MTSETPALYEIEPGNFDAMRTTCGLCGSAEIALFHKDFRGNLIYRCNDCGIQFQNPQYSQDYLNSYYTGYPRTPLKNWSSYRLTDRRKLDFLNRYVEQPGRLLDVGCGNGHFMKAAREMGWDVVGYEVDQEAIDNVSDSDDVTIISGDLSGIVDYSTQHGQFDALVLNQVLEHVKDPHDYFRMFDSVLKPGGHLLIALPNIDSLANRLKRFLEKTGVRKKNIGKYYDTDHHIWYYNRHSISFMLRKYGYEPKCFRGDWPSRKLRTPYQRFKKRLLSFTQVFIWESTFFVVAKKT